MATNQSNLNLPLDVMKKILLLLPFESIPACKLVSKEWKNLIDDPDFFKCFHDTSLSFFYVDDIVYCVSTNVRSIDSPLTVSRIPVNLDRDHDRITGVLSESSKGIVCVINYSCFHVFNMFTGASEPIMYARMKKDACEWLCCGFGYDRYADDCKIMLVCYSGSGDRHEWKHGRALDGEANSPIQVYSLRNRAWKLFDGFPYAAYDWTRLFGFHEACAFNGMLHWVVRTRTEAKNVIIAYDLHTCRFGEMAMPNAFDHNVSPQVVELGGQLCCWDWIVRITLDVWAMKEYGVSTSWVMLLSIGRTMLTSSYMVHGKPAMLYECRDGRKVVLFTCCVYGTLYCYDFNNDEVERITIADWQKQRLTQKR